MLPSVRQTARSVLARLLPGRAFVATLHSSSSSRNQSQEDEARDILFGDMSGTTAIDQAGQNQVSKPRPNYDIMHHYIPPAQSPILQLLTTMMMKDGKYASAAKQTSQLLLHIYAMTRSPPMPIIEQAISLISPAVRLQRMKQRGGKSLIKPIPLSERQRTRLGIKWLIDEVDKKGTPGKRRSERLAKEIMGIMHGESSVLRMKFEQHKTAMINRGNLKKRL